MNKIPVVAQEANFVDNAEFYVSAGRFLLNIIIDVLLIRNGLFMVEINNI